MNSLETVMNALNLAKARMTEVPSFSIYQSIVAQLEYVADVLRGVEMDRGRLRDVMIGHYGAREFEESDPEFASALKDAQLIATKMSKGLKVS
ncbi:hypothetical protein KR767_18925 [Luteibacter anthropi]|uniref:immunity protein Tsi6 family protein n=1 Tax=Luteibacter anthropi TaxID=564369 RepID=UPI0020323F87|nr:immunity protein Tsi6 family protein [Luteibacter anthropi]URX62095.1 hypothetical protein KR767_18925 [Luteibacter anthropi]